MARLFSVCLLAINFFLCMHVADILAQKPWTFLVYMAAANDLHSYALLDLQEMMKIGSNDNINVIVYLTLQENGKQKVTQKLYINNGSMIQIGHNMIRDSGDVATLQEALKWACTNYPSDHMAVVIWDNGSGPLNRTKMRTIQSRGVCYDYDTGHYLTDCDCVQAFSWACNALRGGKKIDIIAFDACFLASLEIAYTLSSCADYMIASEGTIAINGYQYASLLEQFLTTNLDPLSFARLMVSTYMQYAKNTRYTLSVTDLNAVGNVVDHCNTIAEFLTAQLNGKNHAVVRAAIKKCVSDCLSFDQGIYIDLMHFYKNILKNIGRFKLWSSVAAEFKQMLNDGIKSFSTVIQARVASANYVQVGGLSIYFSRHGIDPSYYGLYWTYHNPQWLEFLEAYAGV